MRYGSLAGPFQTPNRFEGGDGPKAATWLAQLTACRSLRPSPLEKFSVCMQSHTHNTTYTIHIYIHIIKQNSSIKKWMVDSVVGAYMP